MTLIQRIAVCPLLQNTRNHMTPKVHIITIKCSMDIGIYYGIVYLSVYIETYGERNFKDI